jgi:hypothetical protein
LPPLLLTQIIFIFKTWHIILSNLLSRIIKNINREVLLS